MIRRHRRQLAFAISFVLLLAQIAVAETPLHEFEEALLSIPVSQVDPMIAAIEIGMSQPDFPAEALLQLIERLSARSAPAIEKEAVLVVILEATQEGLPIDGMVDKAFEGLARNVSLAQIEDGLTQLHVLLAGVRDLLYSKGIFSSAPGTQAAVANALPAARFDLLVLHISEAVDDYLSGGGSPFEENALYQEVHERLVMLQGVTLVQDDVQLVLERINPSDLTQVALTAVS